MSTHKQIDRICVVAVLLSLVLTIAFMNGEALGLSRSAPSMEYESRLFDVSRVHRIDIVMEDWDSFLETCENEEYAACTVVIDGESYRQVGIRAKGNTSLSSVRQMGSSRYSFKLEFDQYDSTASYHGLDKLCLNNLIQDNTMMKDYLVYQMMRQMGVASPLCSYTYITVNGEDWGLYLAVEGIEEGFLQRNYGSNYGQLYKPDSTGIGGGRGNGKDFNPADLNPDASQKTGSTQMPGKPEPPQNASEAPENTGKNPETGENPGKPGSEMSSADLKLQYIDANPDSYPNIFNNAKTDATASDQARLIEALRKLSAGEELETTIDVNAVLRYFVVHNFVCNGDSYTGSMIHNYYLYEQNGQLSMLPWDYNLAFGTFQGGDAASAVNEAIDLSLPDRPMAAWIFENEAYTELYHQYFREFLNTVDITSIIESTAEHIAPYVAQDPGKFCTCEEFEAGVTALKAFIACRTESVGRQLNGDATPVDTAALNLSDMGTMEHGGAMGDEGISAGPQPPDAAFESTNQPPELPDSNASDPQQAADSFPNPGQRPADNHELPPEAPADSGRMPNGAGSPPVQQNWMPYLLLAASCLVLILGIVLVLRFKR